MVGLLGTWAAIALAGGYVVKQARRDQRERDAVDQDEEDEIEDLLDQLYDYEGELIAIVDTDNSTVMQGRVWRVRNGCGIIDTRRLTTAQDGSYMQSPGRPMKKIWRPTAGQIIVRLDEAEDE